MPTTTALNMQKTEREQNDSNTVTVAAAPKSWNVTNNTKVDLVAIDAFLSDPASTDELYQRSLKLLSASNNKQVVKAGTSETFSLSDPHTDSSGNTEAYSVIIARADTLLPVKIVDLSAGLDAGSFPDTTVTADDADRMKLAETFVQSVIAFPSSKMTVDYANVLANPDDQKIAAFFTSYPDYKDINLEMTTAVQTYYNRYGFVWAGYASKKTYYLYISDETNKKQVGTITISNQAVTPVTNLDAMAGLTAVYMDINRRKTDLQFSNGQFSENADSNTPKFCFQGLFVQKSRITGVDTDNTLMPVLYGVMNNDEVFGYNNGNEDEDKSVINELVDALGTHGWLKFSALCAGALAVLMGLGVAAYFITRRIKTGRWSKFTPEEIARLNEMKVAKILERMVAADVKIPADLNKSLSDIKVEADLNLLTETKSRMKRILQKQRAACDTLKSYKRTNELEKAWHDANDIVEHQIDWVPVEQIPEKMDAWTKLIDKNGTLIKDSYDSFGSEIKGRDLGIITEARATSSRLIGEVKTREEIRRELLDDAIPKLEIIEE